MSDKIVTLVVFSNLMEAQLARNRLEAEGIPVQLTGATSGGLLPGMELSFGNFQLLVSEADLERAAAVLGLEEEAEVPPEREEEPEPPSTAIREQGPAGIRAVREEEPPPTMALRPRSPHDQPARDDIPDAASVPRELEEGAEDLDEKVNRRFTYTAEELASRAFRVAVVGLLLCPALAVYCFFFPALLVPLYSLWLLIRMALLPEDVSQAAMLKVYAALAIDVAMLFGPVIILLASLPR
jgi:hypothetical protein